MILVRVTVKFEREEILCAHFPFQSLLHDRMGQISSKRRVVLFDGGLILFQNVGGTKRHTYYLLSARHPTKIPIQSSCRRISGLIMIGLSRAKQID